MISILGLTFFLQWCMLYTRTAERFDSDTYLDFLDVLGAATSGSTGLLEPVVPAWSFSLNDETCIHFKCTASALQLVTCTSVVRQVHNNKLKFSTMLIVLQTTWPYSFSKGAFLLSVIKPKPKPK